tara:strand:- start:33 stop:332 length:300 start_codon:yes stop_codon:yes gene_type:complete
MSDGEFFNITSQKINKYRNRNTCRKCPTGTESDVFTDQKDDSWSVCKYPDNSYIKNYVGSGRTGTGGMQYGKVVLMVRLILLVHNMVHLVTKHQTKVNM